MKNLKLRAWLKEDKEMISVEEMAFDTKYVRGFYKLDSRWFKLEQVELMQSTGLLDKNGEEIFEGDIVSIDTDEFDLLVVKYETGIYWLMDNEECVEHLSDYYKYVSIIGNIYENPELLGQ